jgi:RND family efflux transporter MFP subunit
MGIDQNIEITESRRYRAMHIGLALAVACVIIVSATNVSAQPPDKKPGPPPALVHVAAVLKQEVVTRITLVGTAQPWLETVLASEEEGLVRRMLVDEGDQVQVGQLLCEQDATRIRLLIDAAQASLAEAEVLQVQAKRELKRQKRLFAIHSVAEKAYEDAQSGAEASQKKVLRLRAELRALQDELRKKKIEAPIAGYVVKRHAQVGQWLGQGQPVVTLVKLDPIRFIVPVPERYVAGVNKGAQAQVVFDALTNRSFEGLIAAVIPRADAAARTFPVRVEVPNPGGVIKAGMLGRVTLPAGNPHQAILVPKDALVLLGEGARVFVVNDQVAHLVPVRTGPAHGDLIEIQGNLKPGQKVVTRGNERLRPGQPVQITSEAKPPATDAPKEEG